QGSAGVVLFPAIDLAVPIPIDSRPQRSRSVHVGPRVGAPIVVGIVGELRELASGLVVSRRDCGRRAGTVGVGPDGQAEDSGYDEDRGSDTQYVRSRHAYGLFGRSRRNR